MSTIIKPEYEIINLQSQDELEKYLRDIYTDNRIPVGDITANFNAFDMSKFIHDQGHRNWFTPVELAGYLWHRSNYYELENDID